ncbi:hypothetical protein L1887_62383 [Cichorium endivia]|nr:hypothetical protein L1887_62383 [Cichorium endivia]
MPLRTKENESFRIGQSSANDKYSLELEIDRLKRDLARCEDDLARARKELDRKDDVLRHKEDALAQMHSELREAQAKLASEMQSHLGLSERFEAQQNAIKAERKELDAARAKVEELEHELNNGERANLRSEQATRSALDQRNALLAHHLHADGQAAGIGVGGRQCDAAEARCGAQAVHQL